jgi:hypothetical protein
MLVRFIPDLEDTSLGELFSPKSLNKIFYLTPNKIYQSVGIIKIKRVEFIKVINNIGEIITLDSRWFLPIQQEGHDKLCQLIKDKTN